MEVADAAISTVQPKVFMTHGPEAICPYLVCKNTLDLQL